MPTLSGFRALKRLQLRVRGGTLQSWTRGVRTLFRGEACTTQGVELWGLAVFQVTRKVSVCTHRSRGNRSAQKVMEAENIPSIEKNMRGSLGMFKIRCILSFATFATEIGIPMYPANLVGICEVWQKPPSRLAQPPEVWMWRASSPHGFKSGPCYVLGGAERASFSGTLGRV